ncbi:MAG: 3-methyl-2-oxobutanoate dehydrogenase subunit VorB [Clostridiales bacterium]|nr:3-methyl-2-oxobutanoate dehydrogenase subunit VorB [Clostridiales bacterium]
MKKLMKGNEALAAAAIHAGVKCFFGYPITPQTEVAAYMAKHLPEHDGVFLQAESEISAINMVYGAAGAGFRAMTSSSSPGISLKQEGISYIAGSDLPCVIVNVMRAGPGLGGIQASQSDYFQAVKGGGHGDYRLIVLAPSSVQEMAEMTVTAFNYADKWRMPVMILADGMVGQMMEPVDMELLPEVEHYDKPWAACGKGKREEHNIINSLYLTPQELEDMNEKRWLKYEQISKELPDWEEYMTDDADIIVTAYGIAARIAKAAVKKAREEGIKAGLIRPKTLWPFPSAAFERDIKKVLCVELSRGQMVEDVRLALNGRAEVEFYGRCGGMCVDEEEILENLRRLAG